MRHLHGIEVQSDSHTGFLVVDSELLGVRNELDKLFQSWDEALFLFDCVD
jgi:hypothetical protein